VGDGVAAVALFFCHTDPMRMLFAAGVLLGLAAPVSAEVVASSEGGFAGQLQRLKRFVESGRPE
jgi:hypothetical protein